MSTAPIPFDRSELDGTIVERFARIAAALPDHLAVCGGSVEWSYRSLAERSDRLAAEILRHDPSPGGCAAYLVDHSADMVLCALSMLKAGKAYVCIHPRLPAPAQREILRDSRAKVLITSSAKLIEARELHGGDTMTCCIDAVDLSSATAFAPPPITADTPAVVFYTSGSTGRPKGVVKCHRAVLHRAWLSAQYDRVRPGDRQSLLTYCSFASSEADVFGALLNGATVELFDAATHALDGLREWIDARQITLLHPPVVLFRRFLQTLTGAGRFPSIRLVALAGETVLPSDVRQWRERFSPACELRHRFSSTEAGHIAVATVGPGEMISSTPPAMAVTDKYLSVLDEAGTPCPPGTPGELVVRSAYLADGYWREGAVVRDDFPADLDHPGQRTFRTGDTGRLMSDGRFEFLGRRDGQVKIRGYRVELREIEQALLEQPGVREAAVVAYRYQEETRLAAFVIGPGISTATLRAAAAARLASWKVPTQVNLVDTLPLTLTGKIDRPSLAERAANAPLPDTVESLNGDPITASLLAIWCKLLGRSDVGVDNNFFDIGGHSLLAAQLMHQVGERFGRVLPAATLVARPTVRQLAAWLATPVANGGKFTAAAAAKSDPAAPVTLQSGTGLTPLFFLPPAHGSALTYLPLARLLGESQPAFALLFPDRLEAPTLEAEAGRLLALLRRTRPHGPYRLCGHSFGSLLAYELARQLTAAGETVDRLLLLDGEVLQTRTPLPLPRRLMVHFRTRLKFSHSTRDQKMSRADGDITVVTDGADANIRQQVNARLRLFRAYTPSSYAGRIDLFRADVQPPWKAFLRPQPFNGWDTVCSDIRLHPVPGDHLTMMQEPHLTALAVVMRNAMA